MGVYVKGMKMPKCCHDCRWFNFEGISCTTPQYLLDARCELVPSGQDWYGEDMHGGWVGESIEHIPGWSGRYSYKHCVELGTRAKQCPLTELPEKHGRLVDADALHVLFENQWHYLQCLNWDENPKAETKQTGVNWCINTLHDDAPTIIEAEGDEE